MTRCKFIIGALALVTLFPGLSIVASSDAHAACRSAGSHRCPPMYHPSYHSGAAAAIRFMYHHYVYRHHGGR